MTSILMFFSSCLVANLKYSLRVHLQSNRHLKRYTGLLLNCCSFRRVFNVFFFLTRKLQIYSLTNTILNYAENHKNSQYINVIHSFQIGNVTSDLQSTTCQIIYISAVETVTHYCIYNLQ